MITSTKKQKSVKVTELNSTVLGTENSTPVQTENSTPVQTENSTDGLTFQDCTKEKNQRIKGLTPLFIQNFFLFLWNVTCEKIDVLNPSITCLEPLKYHLIFQYVKENNFHFSKFGSSTNVQKELAQRENFPFQSEKTVLLSDSSMYNFTKDIELIVKIDGNAIGKIGYIGTLLYFFPTLEKLSIGKKNELLKKEKSNTVQTV